MKKITRLAAVALVTLFGWQASAQNGGDDCASAVVAMPGLFTDTTITDTTAGTNNGDAAWFSYTASGDGTITVDSGVDLDEPDTRVFIYDNCTDLNELDSDDDAGPGFTSIIEDFAVVGGTEYIISWDDRWSVGPFDWELSFTPTPTGDSCAEALPVTPGIFLEVAINDSDNTTGSGDALWYVYTPDTSGSITVNSGIDLDEPDTRVFIYDNCTDLTVLDSDDDAGPGFTSTITDFPVLAGTSYYIAWDDRWSLDPFDWELVFNSCPAPFDFAVVPGETDAVFTWTDDPLAVNGYVFDVYADGADPAVDTPIYTENIALGVATATVTGLTDTTAYDAYLTADCDTSGSSTSSMLDFSTSPLPPVCGGKFYDTGGPDGDFMNNEDYQIIISPDNAGDVVTASFVFVDNAGGTFDELTVDIGDGVFVLVPDVNLGDTPIEFTSIAADGSLTFNFFSTPAVPNPGWDADITCGPPPTCPEPSNFTLVNTTETSAVFVWNGVTEAADGYTLSVFDAGADPMADTPVYTEDVATGITTATATGLTPSTSYDAYINSNCGVGDLSTLDLLNFTTDDTPPTAPVCGDKFYDTGGETADYATDENYSFLIISDDPANIVTLDFLLVDIELGFDQLHIYDGNDITAPELSDPTNGVQAPGQFTGTVPGGNLFVTFTSDGSVNRAGWDADVICTPAPATCDAPENLAVSSITPDSADFTWDVVADATNGYTLEVYNAGDDPATATAVATETSATNSVTVTGLTEDTDYDAYVVSNCDTLDSELSTPAVSFTTEMLVGFDDNNLLNVAVFPNPTSSTVTLTTAEAVQSVSVYSVLGQEVMTLTPNASTFDIDLSNVANGTYFVKATSNGATSVNKIIKE